MSKIIALSSRYLMIIGVLSLSGCISLLPDSGPPPAQITLDPQVGPTHFSCKSTMHVEEPTSPTNFNGTKIVVRKSEESGLTVFTTAQGQEWADTLPKLVQRTIVNHLKTPSWPGVLSEARTVLPAYKLSLDIRSFNIVLSQGIEVSVNATLVNNVAQEVVASRTFTYSVPSEHNVKGYVRAFNQATSSLLTDLVGFLRANLN